MLIQKDANVSLKDNDGWTALHNASAQGFLKIVKYFLEYTKADIDVKSNKGYTPLSKYIYFIKKCVILITFVN